MTFIIHRGDCIATLRAMPDNSVDSVVTDPPYGLSDHKPADVVACLTAWLAGEEYRPKKKGFMGRTWDSWVPGPEVWREVFRVLKPGGHVVAFAGSRTHDRMSMALRLAGFECRDTVMWCYSQGFPKSRNVTIKRAFKRTGPQGPNPKLQGKNNPAWKGGVTIRRRRGNYVQVRYVRAPAEAVIMARKDGYVMEHRLEMAKWVGRTLLRVEVVHHVDHDPLNNARSNLELWPDNRSHKLWEHGRFVEGAACRVFHLD